MSASTELVYSFVRRYIRANGFSPSYREIGRACYLSEATVRYHLNKLKVQGRLTFETGKSRTITLC